MKYPNRTKTGIALFVSGVMMFYASLIQLQNGKVGIISLLSIVLIFTSFAFILPNPEKDDVISSHGKRANFIILTGFAIGFFHFGFLLTFPDYVYFVETFFHLN